MTNWPAIIDPWPIFDPLPITTLSPITESSTIAFSPMDVSSNIIEFRTIASSPTLTFSLIIERGPTFAPTPKRVWVPKYEGLKISHPFAVALESEALGSCFSKSSRLARTYSETRPMSYQNPSNVECAHNVTVCHDEWLIPTQKIGRKPNRTCSSQRGLFNGKLDRYSRCKVTYFDLQLV